MDLTTLLYLAIGTLAMIAVMLICRKDFFLPLWKGLVSSVLLTGIGVAGVKLMFFFENGNFAGLSFFGAVFFIPVLAPLITLTLQISYPDYLDLAAPSVAIMLSVMKINCLIAGCCRGKVLYRSEFGEEVRFPSQIFEMICAALIAVLLIYAIKKGLWKRRMFPVFMILYGATRFVLNLFRETDDFWLGMGIGNMWAILSVLLGIAWLIFAERLAKRKAQ